MISKALSGACFAVLVAATAVAAQSAPGAPAKDDPNRQICQASPDTGSRLGHVRICHTAAEWAELRRQTQSQIDHIQNARAGSGQ